MFRRLASRLGCMLGLVALVATSCATAADAGAVGKVTAGMTPAGAINLAGRQRMLSQRLAKAYLMIGQEIQPERARAILDQSTTLFEQQLAQLQGFTPTADVSKALEQLKRSWGDYKPALAARPTVEGARQIYDLSEAVQEAAHRLTLAYEMTTAGRPADRLVNVAGRQRMLSQRIAKYYLFMAWNVNAHASQMEMSMARAEFSSGMNRLFAAPQQSEAIKAELAQLDREWVAYGAALRDVPDRAVLKRRAPEIADLSERVLERTERIVALYEKQAQSTR